LFTGFSRISRGFCIGFTEKEYSITIYDNIMVYGTAYYDGLTK